MYLLEFEYCNDFFIGGKECMFNLMNLSGVEKNEEVKIIVEV